MMLGLIILIIVAFYYFNSANHERRFNLNQQMPAQTPLDILKERFARGEIDREEYLERKQVLSGQIQSISLTKE